VLNEWQLEGFQEKVTLIVSEIVTNAVVATGRSRWAAELPPVRLWLLTGPDGVSSRVRDAVPGLPVPREAGELDENGRGLRIVRDLSARCDRTRW
jgi:anti-sigma regulatory factor (Ser/Thr protein kinase)